MALTDRDSMLRAFFRLLDVDAGDPGLTEFDGPDLEGAYQLLDQGLWDAQDFMVACGLGSRWVTTVDLPDHDNSGRTWTADTHSDNEYVDLPDDFMRLAGDEDESALYDSDGQAWGQLIEWDYRRRVAGSHYWIEGDRLWVGENASPPGDLKMDYHHRLPALTDGTTPDFPEQDRMLIPAYAADFALGEAWVPGGPDTEKRVLMRLRKCQRRAYKRSRRTRQPRTLRPERTLGTHWFGGF